MHFGLLHWNGWEPQPNETAGPLGDVFFFFFSNISFDGSICQIASRKDVLKLDISIEYSNNVQYTVFNLTVVYLNHAKRFRYDLVLLVKLFGVLFGFCENTICFRKEVSVSKCLHPLETRSPKIRKSPN